MQTCFRHVSVPDTIRAHVLSWPTSSILDSRWRSRQPRVVSQRSANAINNINLLLRRPSSSRVAGSVFHPHTQSRHVGEQATIEWSDNGSGTVSLTLRQRLDAGTFFDVPITRTQIGLASQLFGTLINYDPDNATGESFTFIPDSNLIWPEYLRLLSQIDPTGKERCLLRP